MQVVSKINNLNSETPTFKYHDLYFRLIACLIGAHLLVMMGEEFSTLHALTLWSYYPTLLINYIIALLLAQLVRTITIRFDKRFSWEGNFWVRLLLQFGSGVVAVSVLAFLLVLLYFEAFGQDIMASTYPKFEFPFSVALLTILNAYYVLYYFYHRVKFLAATNDEIITYSGTLSVQEGNATVSLPVDQVASIFIYENVLLVLAFDQKTYVANYTLDELESTVLDPQQFFRVNRQLIVNKTACKAYEPYGYGLEVSVQPVPFVSATISQKKVRKFREWFENMS